MEKNLKKNVGFLGGSVVKNLPANAGDTGSIPGPGRSHISWSKPVHHNYGAHGPRACALQEEKLPQ